MPAWEGKISDKGEILRQLDGTQKAIEYALAVIIPTVLAVMMFSYIIYPEIFQTAFLAAVGTAIFTLVPASLAQKLHYQCWARNTMPQRIVSGLIGLIYISLVAVISVSLISASKDLEPQQPTTLAIIASAPGTDHCYGIQFKDAGKIWAYGHSFLSSLSCRDDKRDPEYSEREGGRVQNNR